jgi:DNA repair protein RecN (Recombination protein N)
MLQSLHVHNFALIEDARVDFDRGFTVFTGETGAGKSILIDAFGIALGDRAAAGMVRTGADGFWVQAVFDDRGEKINALLQEQGIEADDYLFLKRRVTAAGKSQSSVNGIPVPLAVLKRFAELLVDIHGQHENQLLLQPQAPRFFTDAFGGEAAERMLQDYQAQYRKYEEAKLRLQKLEEQGSQRERLLDRLAWEIQEISEANLRVGEEEALKEEVRLLQNSGKIMNALQNAYGMLQDDNGALSRLAEIREQIACASRYDQRLKAVYEGVDSAWIAADDAAAQLKDYVEYQNFDPERMTEVQDRLDQLYRLQRKYGNGEEAVLSYLEQAKEQQEQLQDLDNRIARAGKELANIAAGLTAKAKSLTALRKQNAEKLCREVENHIHDLAMPDGKLQIAFTEKPDFALEGKDQMELLFSANAGEPLQPLGRVVSGGELSRLALALKTVLIGISGVNTMVFDEIDTGVGGITAQKMAEKLALIARRGQVICITHLAQIAAFGDRHIRIQKQTAEGRTSTGLAVLNQNERIEEMVRMTAGEHVTKAAQENAAALIKAADKFKKNIFLSF